MPARGPADPGEPRSLLLRFSRDAACRALGFHVLAFYEEDTGRRASVNLSCSDEGARVLVYDEHGCEAESVEAAVRALPRLLGAPVMGLEAGCGSEPGVRYGELTSGIVSLFRSLVYDWARRLALEGREYFLVVGWNGDYAWGPGGENEVRLPLIPGAVFMHTHPGPLCYPSWRDMESFAEFLASGGVAEFIAARGCVFTARLVEPMSTDCYDALLDAASCIRGSGDSPDRYLECLQRASGTSCVALELV